eukprot:519610_1
MKRFSQSEPVIQKLHNVMEEDEEANYQGELDNGKEDLFGFSNRITDNKSFNGMSNEQLIVLNVLVSVVTCLFVIAILLTCYYVWKKYHNSTSSTKKYSFVNANDEENYANEEDK